MSSKWLVGSMVIGTISNLIYRIVTSGEKVIRVVNKHSEMFHIISENEEYTVPHSVFALQFDPKSKWDDMKIGSTYHIKYWGVREKWIGLYPRIYSITLCNENK